jgi:hypothetical protein
MQTTAGVVYLLAAPANQFQFSAEPSRRKGQRRTARYSAFRALVVGLGSVGRLSLC